MLNQEFDATILKSPAKGGWTYLVWPQSAAFFGTHGLVKVSGTMDGQAFRSAFMALGDGNHKLPVKAALLQAMRKTIGDSVHVVLTERLDPPRG